MESDQPDPNVLLNELADLPAKPLRGRLAPYSDIIARLRELGYTYREIRIWLADEAKVGTSLAAVHAFDQRRCKALKKARKKLILSVSPTKPAQTEQLPKPESAKKTATAATIHRLKSGKTDQAAPPVAPYEFDATQPL